MFISDALQLMLTFGAFTTALIALVVELTKNQQKITVLTLAR
ncbi:putative holin-like toxin [Tetragenococcus koreensis]|nr:putative holin-like toxin [Tetragenococcus koreensis]MCF1621605.1 putative holin-like toxin [Tetragenococcus koreensis]MCF1627362.1 putative holin-like toxin [Tetragenococcus koreensis]MCF1632175.1 putative holin-like toxin [Tetragenococcus koreensis]MCF1677696.1 putative holin-like toxin [Tetragenococcus koreensis]MCF1680324.1 putative holin-like toxin [Tetragenococcus koreensis]